MTKAFVSGCAGPTLTSSEIDFFRQEDPWGLILFARNIETPEQVRILTSAFREAVGRSDAPVLVDQEGGRVQRLKPPHWPKYPAPKAYGDLYDRDAAAGQRVAWLAGRLIADDLYQVGITVDCLPCLDVRFPETVDAIGDRAFSKDPEVVAILGKAMAEGARFPQHGRPALRGPHRLPAKAHLLATPVHFRRHLRGRLHAFRGGEFPAADVHAQRAPGLSTVAHGGTWPKDKACREPAPTLDGDLPTPAVGQRVCPEGLECSRDIQKVEKNKGLQEKTWKRGQGMTISS